MTKQSRNFSLPSYIFLLFVSLAGASELIHVPDGFEGSRNLNAGTSKDIVFYTNEADSKLWVSVEAPCSGQSIRTELREGYNESSPVVHRACQGRTNVTVTSGGAFFFRLHNSTAAVSVRYFSKWKTLASIPSSSQGFTRFQRRFLKIQERQANNCLVTVQKLILL